jgi:hypothetical protein
VSAAEKIPWEELALNAEEAGGMFGKSARAFMETVACLPGFPARVSAKPAAWIAGEVKEWRDANRAYQRGYRRSR